MDLEKKLAEAGRRTRAMRLDMKIYLDEKGVYISLLDTESVFFSEMGIVGRPTLGSALSVLEGHLDKIQAERAKKAKAKSHLRLVR